VNALPDEHDLANRVVAATASHRVERRRPGRMASVSLALIPLLGGQAGPELSTIASCYGAAGGLILLSVYCSGQTFLLGAEFTRV
jgi:hypothetical protein